MKVVITGTAQGIGLNAALLFLEMGHEVIGLDIKDAPEVLSQTDNYVHHIVNVRCPWMLPDIPDVDILVNNAGVQDEMLNISVNLVGTINVTEKYALQPNIKSILNVTSVSAHNGAEYPRYTASKGGVLAYTKWLAQEVAKYGATANSISHGGVVTPMTQEIWNDGDKRSAVLQETLLGKWASAAEIAQWIYFVTAINQSMTAQDIIIDNGETAKYNFIQ